MDGVLSAATDSEVSTKGLDKTTSPRALPREAVPQGLHTETLTECEPRTCSERAARSTSVGMSAGRQGWLASEPASSDLFNICLEARFEANTDCITPSCIVLSDRRPVECVNTVTLHVFVHRRAPGCYIAGRAWGVRNPIWLKFAFAYRSCFQCAAVPGSRSPPWL